MMTKKIGLPEHSCTSCGKNTKSVEALTIHSLVIDRARDRLSTEEGFRFCPARDCNAVYTRAASDEVVSTGDLSVEVFQKSEGIDRPVCYCFGHSVRDVQEDRPAKRILKEIESQCGRGLDRCEELNPQGRCCLANVRQVYKHAELGAANTVVADQEGGDADCCGIETSRAAQSDSNHLANGPDAGRLAAGPNAGRLAAGGAVIAAIVSSACCWLPLSLIALGVSAGSVGVLFEAYRLWFLGGASILLGLGFYFVYFRKDNCAPGAACAVPNAKLVSMNKALLWLATAFALIFAFFPNYVGLLFGDNRSDDDVNAARAATAPAAAIDPVTIVAARSQRTYLIDGMSCEGCVGHIKESVGKLSGVDRVSVIYKRKLARVTFASGAHASDQAVIATIDELGFEACLATKHTKHTKEELRCQ